MMKRIRSSLAILLCVAGATHASELPLPASDLEALLGAYALVKSLHAEPADDKTLFRGAIGGMLASLDPHSQYLDKEDLAALRKDDEGEHVGIGVHVEVEADQMHVVAVIQNSPADLAGIEEGDAIVSIDGAPIAGMRSSEMTRRMKGLPGSSVAIGYRRPGTGAMRRATLTRAAMKAQTVWAHTVKPGVSWIRVSEFGATTAGELAAVLQGLDASGMPRGIVLDLRNDPGGLVSAAVGVAGAFLPPESALFSARGNGTAANATVTVDPRYYRARDEPDVLASLPVWTRTLPLIVLVNGASASSAELVAGALQDNGRAKVLGTRTFGKGTIQSIFPLTEDSAVKITVARYFTPNGKEIQANGITPDVIVAPLGGHSGSHGQVLREEDLEHHLKATMPTLRDATHVERAALESTRIFGTEDDRALATAVAMLSPVPEDAGRPWNIIGKLALRMKSSGTKPKSL